MLSQLHIKNFAIVDHLEIDLSNGMSVITGETGAGKSIAIDALSLCLGQRVETSMIRQGQARADVTATFTLNENPLALQWLTQQDLVDEENTNECIIRRTITQEGRSKAFINSYPVSATQLKELGQLLIHISGQHTSQQLLKPDFQLNMLDNYCDNHTLLAELSEQYQQWKILKKQLSNFKQQCIDNEARRQLLKYQVEELEEFDLQEGEFAELSEMQNRLSNSEALSFASQSALQLLGDNDRTNIDSMLYQVSKYVDDLNEMDPRYQNVQELIQNAMINVQEAFSELQQLDSDIEQDPEQLGEIEERMRQAMQLAKKHHIDVEALPSHQQTLKQELIQLNDFSEGEDKLIAAEKLAYETLLNTANCLSQKRVQGAVKLAQLATKQIKQLAMENAEFYIDIATNEEKITTVGIDNVTFMLRSNLGQPMQPLAKIASGGELSRIALVLQVLTSGKQSIPTLIFDEIDVGISGGTANTVGKLLRRLGQKCQVLCVTHLPQVAAQGHHHFNVEKFAKAGETITTMQLLSNTERVKELARLLGGAKITQNTLANAQEMLDLAS